MRLVYIVKRIALMVPLMVVISLLSFALVRVAPGGPFDKDRVPASPEIERALRAKFHLDEPLWKQYVRYVSGLCRADFGPSMKYRSHTVNDIIAQGLPISLALGGMAFLFALTFGTLLGIAAALRNRRWLAGSANLAALLCVCVPAFVVGPVLITVFALKLRWFPVALWGGLSHWVLPVITLGVYFTGRVARLMREGMLSVLDAEFITTARAKGLSEGAVILKHAWPIAVLPVVSYSGPLLADLLTGSFVVENIFQLPGIGVFMVNSSLNRDYTMVVGLVVLYAAILLVLNLVVDFLYGLLDPRIKYD